MTARIPLVINSGAIQELQTGDSFNLGTGASLTSPTIATSMTLSYGTANQVQYLNGSKQLVGDADLTFDGTTLSVAAINVTTVDLTNLEVTNIKAKDGTASITLADSTGVATLSANPILNAGTANGVAYLNGSKVLTTGSALTFNGSTLGITGSVDFLAGSPAYLYNPAGNAYSYIKLDSSNVMQLFNNANSATAFSIGGSEQMRLTSTGLGIGTSSPSCKLNTSAARSATVISALFEETGTGAVSDVNKLILKVQNTLGGSTGGAGIGAVLEASASNQTGLAFYYDGGSGVQTEGLRLNSAGNLGLGVTPSAWGSSYKAFQVLYNSSIYAQYGAPSVAGICANGYIDSSYAWRYGSSAYASQYEQNAGQHRWYTAPSGTAGNAISFTQAMTLDASGNLTLGKIAFNIDSPFYTGANISSGANQLGIGSTGASPVGFFTNNAERMRIDSSGNVGIGFSSPTEKLCVAGNLLFDQNRTITLNGVGTALITNPADAGIVTLNTGTTAGYVTSININGGGASPANTILFNTASTERMRIDSSGNVGIGTSTAYARLNVVNGGGGALATQYAYNYGASNWNHRMLPAGGSGVSAYLGNLTGDLSSFSGAYYYGGGLYYSEGTAAYGIINSANNSAICFYANSGLTAGGTFVPTERMRIDSSGNLLVGTTSTTNGALINFYKDSGTIETSLGGTTAAQNHIVFANPNGNVGSIQVSGSATSFNTSSDYRLKENIQPMQNALDVVQQLNPVTYTWKADGSDGQGFIAHELQAVVPDCVTGEKDAVDEEGNPVYQGIDTSFLVATLTKAIQEQQEQINQLKAEVAALKGK